MGKIEDLTGQKFNRLTAIGFNRKGTFFSKNTGKKYYRYYWDCKCDCGNNCVIEAGKLKSGWSKSCGCYNLERISERFHIHGLSKTYMESTRRNILDRCYKETTDFYKDYGGRGITVCDRWKGKDGLKNFAEDMGERPEGTQIDRIDNNGPYSPENCRWATNKENCRNKRDTKFITFNGKTQSLPDWADELGMSNKVLSERIIKWGEYRALAEPLHKTVRITRDSIFTFNNKTLSLDEWSTESGIPFNTLKYRISKSHWSIGRSLTTPLKEDKGDLIIVHLGRAQTIKEWAKEAGFSVTVLKKRLFDLKWDLERALREPLHNNGLGKKAALRQTEGTSL
jgi:hypothetical protein